MSRKPWQGRPINEVSPRHAAMIEAVLDAGLADVADELRRLATPSAWEIGGEVKDDARTAAFGSRFGLADHGHQATPISRMSDPVWVSSIVLSVDDLGQPEEVGYVAFDDREEAKNAWNASLRDALIRRFGGMKPE